MAESTTAGAPPTRPRSAAIGPFHGSRRSARSWVSAVELRSTGRSPRGRRSVSGQRRQAALFRVALARTEVAASAMPTTCGGVVTVPLGRIRASSHSADTTRLYANGPFSPSPALPRLRDADVHRVAEHLTVSATNEWRRAF